MKVGRIVKIAAICCSMSALLLSTLSVAAIAQQDKVGWYAELYLENPDYIVVRIDLRGLPTNRYIEDVSFEVTFHDAQSWVAEQNFDFTDSGLRRLTGGVVHERYFEHSYGFAQSAKGGDLFYTISTQGLMLGPPPSGRPTGGRSGAVPKERKRSGDRIQTSDIQLSGALPRPRSSRRTGDTRRQAGIVAKRERWRCGSDFGAGGRGSIEFKVTRSPEGGRPEWIYGGTRQYPQN